MKLFDEDDNDCIGDVEGMGLVDTRDRARVGRTTKEDENGLK